MNEQEYADIAAACDRLLRSPSTSLERLAIPALHFLNEHPSALAQYASLHAERLNGQYSGIPKAVMRAARGLTHSLTAPRSAAVHRGPFDVMIVSHLLRPEQLQQDNDFYFGALQSHLKENGVTCLLVLIDHLPGTPNGRNARSSQCPRMILPATVSPAKEVNIWKQCTSAFKALLREAEVTHDPLGSRLALLASRQAFEASTISNLRMHDAIARLCQAISPKIVITTYEGTVAERLIWHAARTANSRPLCVGYQHAMMLERAHAMRRPVAAPGIACDPEVVLTLGEVSHAALAASAGLQGVRFIVYGSHRRAILPVLPQPQHRPSRCLVLADASDRECTMLFNFALDCARQNPNISFALRPHPMVDTWLLLRRHPALKSLPENVALSVNTPLEQEFAQTRYCLYRGSSAAMLALRAGIKPFCLAPPGELSVDCLSGFADWREQVASPQDLLNGIRRADQFIGLGAADHAASMCDRFVAPLRPAAITELLAMAPQ